MSVRGQVKADIEEILKDNWYKTDFCITDLVAYVMKVRRSTVVQIRNCLREQGLDPEIKVPSLKEKKEICKFCGCSNGPHGIGCPKTQEKRADQPTKNNEE